MLLTRDEFIEGMESGGTASNERPTCNVQEAMEQLALREPAYEAAERRATGAASLAAAAEGALADRTARFATTLPPLLHEFQVHKRSSDQLSCLVTDKRIRFSSEAPLALGPPETNFKHSQISLYSCV